MPSRAERGPRPGRTTASFTTRGSSILAAALAAAVGSVALGETDLLRVAIIILVVCAVTWLLSRFAPFRVSAPHTAEPAAAPVGAALVLRPAAKVWRPVMPASVVCHDRVREGLSETNHLAVASERLRDGISLAFSTTIRTRGAHLAGPLEVSMRDPLGLVTSRRAAREQLTIMGLPRWHAVHPGWLAAGGEAPLAAGSPASRGLQAEPDVGIREHRPDDGLRRIHWRSSARTGRLMTRLDEPQQDRCATIAYDSRVEVHRGESFEVTVEVVASLAVAALRSGLSLRLVDSAGEAEAPANGWDERSVLHHLALVASSQQAQDFAVLPKGDPVLIVTTSAALATDAGTSGPRDARVVVVDLPGRRPGAAAEGNHVGGTTSVPDLLSTAPSDRVPA